MDMKRILQAMDGVATKPVVGANDMAKFIRVVSESNNTPAILEEGTNHHKVALPVQMAMQHYQQPTPNIELKPSLLKQYFAEAEEEISTQLAEEEADRKLRINMYAHKIANRVLMKESKNRCSQCGMTNCTCPAGKCKCKPIAGWVPGKGFKKAISESPIEMTNDPNDPHIYGHEKANPMSLKGRIMSARAQLKELAQLAERDDLLAWEEICKKSKGGMFMGLEQNLEQIRHGINELAAKRRQGGIASRGIDKNIGEAVNAAQQAAIAIAKKKEQKADESLKTDNPCWTGYKPVGTKKKGGKTVPNCVPKE